MMTSIFPHLFVSFKSASECQFINTTMSISYLVQSTRHMPFTYCIIHHCQSTCRGYAPGKKLYANSCVRGGRKVIVVFPDAENEIWSQKKHLREQYDFNNAIINITSNKKEALLKKQ